MREAVPLDALPLPGKLHLTVDFFHTGPGAPDNDNIVKPIADALKGLLYSDDAGVEMTTRDHDLSDLRPIVDVSPAFLDAIAAGHRDFVHIRLAPADHEVRL